MEISDGERRAYHFAELVRKLTIKIAAKASGARPQDAAELALMLCNQAAQRKREIMGEPEPDPERLED